MEVDILNNYPDPSAVWTETRKAPSSHDDSLRDKEMEIERERHRERAGERERET